MNIPTVDSQNQHYIHLKNHILPDIIVSLGDITSIQEQTEFVVEKLCAHSAWLDRQHTGTLFAMKLVFEELYQQGFPWEWSRFFKLNQTLILNKEDFEDGDSNFWWQE